MRDGLALVYLRESAAVEAQQKAAPPARWYHRLKTWTFWRESLAEFVGTFFYTFLGTAATLSLINPNTSTFMVAAAFGLASTAMLQCFGHVSGAHLNPAVTLGFSICGQIHWLNSTFYVIFQYLGAMAGSGVLFLLTPEAARGNLGATLKHDDVTVAQAIVLEIILTLILVLVYLGTCDPKRPILGLPSVAIGLSLTGLLIVGIPLSGGSLNPARYLAPAVILLDFPSYSWVYFVGDYIGGGVAGVLYRFVFSPYKTTETQAVSCANGTGSGEGTEGTCAAAPVTGVAS